MTTARFLILPGWQDSDPAHWQSLWAQRAGFERLAQADWWWPRRGDWMANLEEAVLANPVPTVLVAHSLGCHLVARWAAHSQQVGRVKGALLVAPADIVRPDMPPQLQAWGPILADALPFATTVVASDNDPFASLARAQQMARQWGSDWVLAPGAGHLNSASGLGNWPDGQRLLQALCAKTGVIAPQNALQSG